MDPVGTPQEMEHKFAQSEPIFQSLKVADPAGEKEGRTSSFVCFPPDVLNINA